MTPYPAHPQQSRKDIDNLIFHQADIPCLQGGSGTESILAFLMQLYAFVCSNFGAEVEASLGRTSAHSGGTAVLKDHLMTSGRYQVVVYKTDFRARPNALRLRQRPAIYNGASIGTWIILWPGAERDTYFKTGRVVSAFATAIKTCRADGALAVSATDEIVENAGYSSVHSTLHKTQRPIRLIPP